MPEPTSVEVPTAPTPARRAFTGLVGLPPEPEVKPVQKPTLSRAVVSEDELRDWFGVEERNTKPTLPESYRKFFGLEPDDLIRFFDVQIGSYPEFAQVDFIVPPSMIQHRLRRLQKTINYLNDVIKGLDVGVMKIRRGKENVLDKPTREKYKREEQARLTRCYAKRAKYYAAAKQERYVEKVWHVIDRPIYFRDVVDDCMLFKSVEKRWFEHQEVCIGGKLQQDVTDVLALVDWSQFDLEGYKRIMTLGSLALEELGENAEEVWENLQRWENAVIAAAIAHHVIDLPQEKCEFLGLTEYVKDLNSRVKIEDSGLRDLDSEDISTIEGGSLGNRMRIQTDGFRYRANGAPVPRNISSFDRPTRMTVRSKKG